MRDDLKKMIYNPRSFYINYQKDYHLIKATYLNNLFESLNDDKEISFWGNLELERKEEVKRVLKSDLRQTYFHSIETFFELFFALNPKGKESFDDEYVLYLLANSNWQDTYKKIKIIAENENSLDYLNEEITFLNQKVSIGHFLFYAGIFQNDKFPKELFDEINDSIEAIKFGIHIIAKDFIDREEYNAYKHGLRLIPSFKKVMFVSKKDFKVKIEWDLSDSMSFYSKSKKPEELIYVTKVFDFERDYQMTCFCSHMIHHMIFYRRLMMKFEEDEGKFDPFKITFFGKEPIENCNKRNTDAESFVYTITKQS